MNEKIEKKPRKSKAVNKKKYCGIVISPFKTTSKTYEIGDKFFTSNKESLKYLINKKIVK